MFSMVVDEIVTLKQNQLDFEKELNHRHRINLSLNNEVCAKLEKLEKGLDSNRAIPISQEETRKKISRPNLKKTAPSHFGYSNMDSEPVMQCIPSISNKF